MREVTIKASQPIDKLAKRFNRDDLLKILLARLSKITQKQDLDLKISSYCIIQFIRAISDHSNT